MISQIKANRTARTAALRLMKQGVYVPLPKLTRAVTQAVKTQGNTEMPPEVAEAAEVATKEDNDLRVVALETALSIHESMIAAQPEYFRAVDVHLWPDRIRNLYLRILNDLRA